jgi:hypothetical protein
VKWIQERILDILLVSSIGTVAFQRAFRSVPEVFPGGAAIGEVLATLATGFIGAWFFNLINIRLPKNREKEAVVGAVGVAIAQYASQARNILQDMALSLSMPPVPRKPDRRVLAEILGKINPNGASRIVRVALNPPPLFRVNFLHIVELHEQYPVASSDTMPHATYQEGGEFVTRNQLGYGDMALNSLVARSPVFHQLAHLRALGLVAIILGVPVSQVSS